MGGSGAGWWEGVTLDVLGEADHWLRPLSLTCCSVWWMVNLWAGLVFLQCVITYAM